MVTNKVSLPVIRRLPKYYRYVHDMQRAGISTVSSSELAAAMGTTASQVRQDFNCFGGFGQQGIGYSVDVLAAELEKLLFSGEPLNTILIGTGRLGRAIGHYLAYEAKGHKMAAVFDKNPAEIGRDFLGLTVQDINSLKDFCSRFHPQIAVLCIPEDSARQLAPTLLELGITGFWNFSHYDLSSNSPEVVVQNVHLGDSLMSLGYRVRNPQNESSAPTTN